MSRAARSLSRARWALDRFGLTPRKAVRRLRNRDEPRVLCVTIPKAGTNLLQRVVCLHPHLYRRLIPTVRQENLRRWGNLTKLLARLRPGQVIVAHLRFNPFRERAVEGRGVRCIFMIRDPRDVVVSYAFYVTKSRRHPMNRVYRRTRGARDRVRTAIQGAPGQPSIRELLEEMAEWLRSDACLVVRFEDLVGPEGGGDGATQIGTLRSIFDYIGVPVQDEWLMGLRARLFSESSPTFRRGAIGGWRDHFDDETKALFKRVAGDLLVRYGYEAGDDW